MKGSLWTSSKIMEGISCWKSWGIQIFLLWKFLENYLKDSFVIHPSFVTKIILRASSPKMFSRIFISKNLKIYRNILNISSPIIKGFCINYWNLEYFKDITSITKRFLKKFILRKKIQLFFAENWGLCRKLCWHLSENRGRIFVLKILACPNFFQGIPDRKSWFF